MTQTAGAFFSEPDIGSRRENAAKQERKAGFRPGWIGSHFRAEAAIFLMPEIMTEKPNAEKLSIFVCRAGDEKASAHISGSLGIEVAARFGSRNERPLSIHAHDGDVLVGGLEGCTHWHWCYIRQLWIEMRWRGRGVGRRLLTEAETAALERNCIGLYLDTFDPEAEKFYEQCGFRRFGRIDDFPPGHARRFLYKRLVPSGNDTVE